MSSRNLRFLVTLVAIACAIGTASAAFAKGEASFPRHVPCQASGYAVHPDTEIRASPSADAPLLAKVSPRGAIEGGFEIAGTLPEFEIRGYRDGWFLIAGTSYGDYGDYGDDPLPEAPLYAGEGWMHGRDISGQLRPGRLHRAPSESSRSREYGVEPDAIVVRRLLACQGWWVKVETDIGTGWAPGMCGNQVTTCN